MAREKYNFTVSVPPARREAFYRALRTLSTRHPQFTVSNIIVNAVTGQPMPMMVASGQEAETAVDQRAPFNELRGSISISLPQAHRDAFHQSVARLQTEYGEDSASAAIITHLIVAT